MIIWNKTLPCNKMNFRTWRFLMIILPRSYLDLWQIETQHKGLSYQSVDRFLFFMEIFKSMNGWFKFRGKFEIWEN